MNPNGGARASDTGGLSKFGGGGQGDAKTQRDSPRGAERRDRENIKAEAQTQGD